MARITNLLEIVDKMLIDLNRYIKAVHSDEYGLPMEDITSLRTIVITHIAMLEKEANS